MQSDPVFALAKTAPRGGRRFPHRRQRVPSRQRRRCGNRRPPTAWSPL